MTHDHYFSMIFFTCHMSLSGIHCEVEGSTLSKCRLLFLARVPGTRVLVQVQYAGSRDEKKTECNGKYTYLKFIEAIVGYLINHIFLQCEIQ